jgi:hypothetical protein
MKKYSVFITSDSGLVLCAKPKRHFPKVDFWQPFQILLHSDLPDVFYTNQDWCDDTQKTWHWLDGQKLAPIDSISHPLQLLGYIINQVTK